MIVNIKMERACFIYACAKAILSKAGSGMIIDDLGFVEMNAYYSLLTSEERRKFEDMSKCCAEGLLEYEPGLEYCNDLQIKIIPMKYAHNEIRDIICSSEEYNIEIGIRCYGTNNYARYFSIHGKPDNIGEIALGHSFSEDYFLKIKELSKDCIDNSNLNIYEYRHTLAAKVMELIYNELKALCSTYPDINALWFEWLTGVKSFYVFMPDYKNTVTIQVINYDGSEINGIHREYEPHIKSEWWLPPATASYNSIDLSEKYNSIYLCTGTYIRCRLTPFLNKNGNSSMRIKIKADFRTNLPVSNQIKKNVR